jgi:hypothetical protein
LVVVLTQMAAFVKSKEKVDALDWPPQPCEKLNCLI